MFMLRSSYLSKCSINTTMMTCLLNIGGNAVFLCPLCLFQNMIIIIATNVLQQFILFEVLFIKRVEMVIIFTALIYIIVSHYSVGWKNLTIE